MEWLDLLSWNFCMKGVVWLHLIVKKGLYPGMSFFFVSFEFGEYFHGSC